jgi:hypothetical protein
VHVKSIKLHRLDEIKKLPTFWQVTKYPYPLATLSGLIVGRNDDHISVKKVDTPSRFTNVVRMELSYQ